MLVVRLSTADPVDKLKGLPRMPIKRLTAVVMFVLGACGAFAAVDATQIPSAPATPLEAPMMARLASLAPGGLLAQSALPETPAPAPGSFGGQRAAAREDNEYDDVRQGDELRRMLVGLALKLRHIPYVRGGHDPTTGFDCSGFVRYVFEHAIGVKLPVNSISQFRAGQWVPRTDMQPGDLVFFRTEGVHGRVSHVGMYLDNGRFIHSPSHGETVHVSNLGNSYWARRFAGARRPTGIVESNGG